MRAWILGGIRNCRVWNFFQRKSFARVSNTAGHRSTGANVRYLDVLVWVEVTAVFHGVEEHFTEGTAEIPSILEREILTDLIDEVNKPVGSGVIAAGKQADP